MLGIGFDVNLLTFVFAYLVYLMVNCLVLSGNYHSRSRKSQIFSLFYNLKQDPYLYKPLQNKNNFLVSYILKTPFLVSTSWKPLLFLAIIRESANT